MFDLIEGKVDRPFRDRKTGPAVVSIVGHIAIVFVLIVLPVLYMTDQLPEVPVMMAFVVPAQAVAPPPPPPPPPPPKMAAAKTPAADVKPKAVPTAGLFAAPLEAPKSITPEPEGMLAEGALGVEGGVEGGIPGGVLGGVLGGIAPPPPPPPPPPAPRPSGPVRIGGQIKTPALLHRVEPIYPDIAVAAKVTGTVILEAVVGEDGRVREVKVVQGRPFLDAAARDAVRQWRYSPLILNETPTPFILTVTLSFSMR